MQSRNRILSEDEGVQQIVSAIQAADPRTAPFALVLGAGFSYGLVPTASEVVLTSLPLWMEARKRNTPFPELQKDAGSHRGIAQSYWKQFVSSNGQAQIGFSIDQDTGLPTDNPAAYRAAFSSDYTGALGLPALARKFQRDIMRLDRPRLNAAHFYLASLLSAQPDQPNQADLFNAPAAFSRLILTTNFDPFLQTALQSVNKLYFMSDTPELGIGDEIFDEYSHAVHLVYLHGSIHRRWQIASDRDIQQLKNSQSNALVPVLKKCGVIVMGYSGWDDVMLDALARCDRFDYGLYWCGLKSDPFATSAFSPRVTEQILTKGTAKYVQIQDAGLFMARLSRELLKGLPRLLVEPIAPLREMLSSIDLTQFESKATSSQATMTETQLQWEPETLAFKFKRVLTSLKSAEQHFLSKQTPLTSASTAFAIKNYAESIRLFTEALSSNQLDKAETIQALMERGIALYFSGDVEKSLDDWSTLIDLVGTPPDRVARALINRGIIYAQKADLDGAISDYTRAIELPGTSTDKVADALINRGIAYAQKGDSGREIENCTSAIELSSASVEKVARALIHRGIAWARIGDSGKAIADYTQILDLSGAPAENIVQALYNRGNAWVAIGDAERAIADYTRVIESIDSSLELVAGALNYRGITWGQKNELGNAISDFTRVIEMTGIAPEQIVIALRNRAVAWRESSDLEKAITDYTTAVNLPGTPVEEVAKVLNGRGVTFADEAEYEKAIADYTKVVELLGAPTQQVATALYNRGAAWGKKGELEKAISDNTRLIELPNVSADQIAEALVNRGVAYGLKGDLKAIADYTSAISLPDAPPEQIAIALTNRGWTYFQQNDFEAFLSDTQAAIAIDDNRATPIFNLGLAFLACGRDQDALATYAKGMTRFSHLLESLALPDLLAAEKTWLSADRAKPVRELLERRTAEAAAT